MSFRLETGTELRSQWAPVIEHQFALTLASVNTSLKNPLVRFAEVRENGTSRFRCTFLARSGGELLELACEHQDGRIAIGDTFSRVRRAISRRRSRMADRTLNRTAPTSQLR
jgi:hypothetical protein